VVEATDDWSRRAVPMALFSSDAFPFTRTLARGPCRVRAGPWGAPEARREQSIEWGHAVHGREPGRGRPRPVDDHVLTLLHRCRPLVVSADPLNEGPAGVVIVVPTTTTRRGLPSHVEIEPGSSGVDEISYAKCEDRRPDVAVRPPNGGLP
jgi:hypothetical protein